MIDRRIGHDRVIAKLGEGGMERALGILLRLMTAVFAFHDQMKEQLLLFPGHARVVAW